MALHEKGNSKSPFRKRDFVSKHTWEKSQLIKKVIDRWHCKNKEIVINLFEKCYYIRSLMLGIYIGYIIRIKMGLFDY